MVRHAAMLVNIGQRGDDGRTAWERVKGRRFNRGVPGFGERVMYLKPDSLGKDKLDSRWETGHFLGIQDDSAELIVGTSIGVLKVRSVRSYTNIADRWKALNLFEVVGVPWCPIPGREGVEIKSQVKMAAEFGDKMQHGGDGEPQPFVVRAVKFLKEDVRKYGMTQGRPGCTAANRNAAAVNHSDARRIHIEKLMAEDRHPRYMRAMERLAEAALRKESENVEATATTTATNIGIPGGHATATTRDQQIRFQRENASARYLRQQRSEVRFESVRRKLTRQKRGSDETRLG